MKNLKKWASALLALVLMFGVLTACDGGDNPSSESEAEETPEFVYVPSYTTLGADSDTAIDYVQTCCFYNEKLYFVANIKEGTETQTYPTSETDVNGEPIMETYEYDTYRAGLFSSNTDGTGLAELTDYVMPEVPEGSDGSANINKIFTDAQGNLWAYETLYTYTYDLPDDFDETMQSKWDYYVDDSSQYFIRKLDENGAELTSVDISFLQGDSDYFYLNTFTMDGEGNLYLTDGDSNIYVLDGNGTELFEIEAGENSWINGMITLADGRVAIQTYDDTEQKNVFKTIDPDTQDYGDSFAAPVNSYDFYPGNDDYDFFYNSGASFFGYDIESETSEKVLTWINCDVDSNNLSAILPMSDGRILCCATDYRSDTAKTEIITMTKTPYDQVEHKTTLTFACMYLDYNIRSQILKFNKTNDTYRIEVKDYSEYNTDEDYSAGLTKLTTEIITGKVPDILDANSLPVRQFAAKGLFEDLWPYIDADTQLGGRDALVSSVFKAMEQDGKLYMISPSFSIYTVVGASSVVGDEPGWTLDELLAAYETMPEGAEIFSQGTTKASVLQQCLSLAMEGFVDWSTGECSFDSPDFIKLLEFTELFPAEFDWDKIDYEAGDYEDLPTRITSGKQMLSTMYLSDFQNFQMYKAMFGGDLTFIGYPNEARDGTAFYLDGGLVMSASCKDKDGAWEFMRTLLTEDYQEENIWGFPTNQNRFDEKLEEAMTPEYTTDPETGEQVEISKGNWGWGSMDVELYALTQEEADQIQTVIETTDRVYSNYDESIMTIINEEVEAYFAGQKSAEDTANMIQSRASLYVNEQR